MTVAKGSGSEEFNDEDFKFAPPVSHGTVLQMAGVCKGAASHTGLLLFQREAAGAHLPVAKMRLSNTGRPVRIYSFINLDRM